MTKLNLHEPMVASGDPISIVATSGAGFWDLLIVGAVVLLACLYLYRKIWVKRGACSDCASGGVSGAGCSACPTDPIEFDLDTPLSKDKESND